jgi:hypothetical protein
LVEALGARMTMLLAGIGTATVGVIGTVLYARIPSSDRRTVLVPTAPHVSSAGT